MEQITSSYNLFVDTSTGHNAQSKGDDFMVNLQDAGVHAGEGEHIRMSLSNFSMAKTFHDINDTNNKFKFIFVRAGVTASFDLFLDKGNYTDISELATNFGEKIRHCLANQNPPIPGVVDTNAVVVPVETSRDNIIRVTIDTGGTHGITSAIIQFNSDESDSYMILGGDRVRSGDNTTNSVAPIQATPANPNPGSNLAQIIISSKYPAQRASMPFVYIRAPGVQNTNIETQGLRNSSDNHNSDVAHSNILGRAVVESSEWVQFTAQSEQDFFIDIHQKQLNVLRLQLTDSKNRLLGRLAAGGNTAAGNGNEQSTLGNLSFSAVIRFDIIKRKSVHHLETEHYQPNIPARFSEGNVPIKIR